MPSSAAVKIISRHSSDALDCPVANARSKRKAARASSSVKADSLSAELDLSSQPNLCRYKTGRCTNARVVKPNGSLLLLCEFHRSQQNRTKKRSDMKYRQDRAKKRMVERQQVRDESPDKVLPLLHSHIRSDTVPSTSAEACRSKKATRTHRHARSDRLKAFADLYKQSESEFSMASPRKDHGDDSFFVTGRGSQSSCRPSQRRFFSRRSIRSSILELDLEDADIAIDHEVVGSMGDVTSSVFSFCVTPLSTARRYREPFWQPGDVRLLEYFIL